MALLDFALYNGLVFFNDSDTVLSTTVAESGGTIPLGDPYPFELVRFDCTAGASISPIDFICSVVDEADALHGVPPARRPTCTVVVAP